LDLRDIVTDYEILAKQGLKLNKSYLEMIDTYNELNLAPDLLSKVQDSIFQVIDSMQRDREILIDKLSSLNQPIEHTSKSLIDRADLEQLQKISHDIPIMIDFIKSIDIVDLQQMFINLTPTN
jgi:ABC-type phosphate transport system auxiliary subunit